MSTMDNADSIAAECWDAVVVGTGVGGGTLGLALAANGWSVLFCEIGRSRGPGELAGDYAEQLAAGPGPTDALDALQRAGRWRGPIDDRSAQSSQHFVPFIGCGAGGSSALYGMAMERLFPADFLPGVNHPAVGSALVPEAWPIGYAELESYYREAERLYRVRGSADPLRPDRAELMPAPALTTATASLANRLAERGLHPYQLPNACEFVAGCKSCQGYLCPQPCKNDSGRVALRPAVERHGAVLLDECEVVRLNCAGRTVASLECVRRGRPLTLRGRTVILAAGALHTPALLRRSASPDWPDGLANESGLVGRNLMRHLIELYAVKLPGDPPADNRRKEIAFNDFYMQDGAKLGTVQSFGRLPPADMVIKSLREEVGAGRHRWLLPLLRLGVPVLRAYLARMIDRRLTLASMVEDLPYPHNRVELLQNGERGISVRYRPGDYEHQRTERMRALMKGALAPLRYRRIDETGNNRRIAHACGTCRFGNDPRTSVLDRNCRAHGLENLYVVDSSFFPTSGGTNPSLTIAANALRVAAFLTGRSAPGLLSTTSQA